MFLKNNTRNFPIPFNKKSGIEVANLYQELPSEFKKLITGIAGCSPYLKDLLIKYRNWLFERLSNDPSSIIDELNNDLILSKDLSKSLRIAKSKMALWTALCDLGGYWDLNEVTYNLTKFADLAVKHCMDYEFKRSLKFKKLKIQSAKLNRLWLGGYCNGQNGGF